MNSSSVIQIQMLSFLLSLLFSRLILLNAVTVPMPHTLLLPQGFDPPAAPRQRMHYPVSVSTEMLPKLLKIPTETPDWQPLTVPLRNLKLPLASAWSTYAPTTPLNGQNKDIPLTNLSVNENPVFESIVYGAWKSNPPFKMFNSSVDSLATSSTNLQRQNILKPIYYERSAEHKSPKLTEKSEKQQPIEQKQWLTKKPGRYKIRPTIERRTIRDDQEIPVTEIIYSLKNDTVHTTEVIPSTQDKHHETTIKITTTTNIPTPEIQLTTLSEKKIARTTNSSILDWPKDFMDTLLLSTTQNLSNDTFSTEDYNMVLRKSSESPLALSALNIPPSLWPQLPGNITKLGKPYESRSSSEEPALCVPITINEPSISNPHKLISVERVYCFPLPNTTNKIDDFVTKNHMTSGIRLHWNIRELRTILTFVIVGYK
uniref:Uncharacterized protein n=1 Tax=Glossina palpalis gambiensis TaxID=67801 RepID=A0A1B0AMB0_9MUSC